MIDGMREANATGAQSSMLPPISDYNSASLMGLGNTRHFKGNTMMNQSASGLTMILGSGLDPRANQSVATSIHRVEASLPAMERRNTETTI